MDNSLFTWFPGLKTKACRGFKPILDIHINELTILCQKLQWNFYCFKSSSNSPPFTTRELGYSCLSASTGCAGHSATQWPWECSVGSVALLCCAADAGGGVSLAPWAAVSGCNMKPRWSYWEMGSLAWSTSYKTVCWKILLLTKALKRNASSCTHTHTCAPCAAVPWAPCLCVATCSVLAALNPHLPVRSPSACPVGWQPLSESVLSRAGDQSHGLPALVPCDVLPPTPANITAVTHVSITCGAQDMQWKLSSKKSFWFIWVYCNICSTEQLNQKLHQISKNNGCVK